MNPMDALCFGVLLFAGLFPAIRFLLADARWSRLLRTPERIIEAHRRAQEKLVGGSAFSVPGGLLVRSLRAWAAGEIVWVFIISAILACSPTLRGGISSFFIATAAGSLIVYVSLREQAKRLLHRVRSDLPVASFLFSLLLEAGMGSHAALQEVARAIPRGPLADELEDLCRSRMLGISREEAWERSRRRVPLDDYHIFLNLVDQGERLGLGLSKGLRDHSSKMLEGEGFRAEAAAQKAAVKLLFPLVVFIFPAVALVIFSPVILALWEMWGQ